MFLLSPYQQAALIVFLISAMLGVGMQVTPADVFQRVLGRGLLLRTLLANFVVVPVIGILMARFLITDPGAGAAFVLLACTPGGISALQFTTKARGTAAYAGVTAALLSLLAVVLSPLILALAMPPVDAAMSPLAGACRYLLSVLGLPLVLGRALLFLLGVLVVPMLLGMAFRARSEAASAKAAKAMGLLSAVLFVTLIVALMGPRKEAIQQLSRGAVGVLMLFVGVSMAAGWLLGGPETGTRQVLASATSMRNVALAMAIAVSFPGADRVLPALIAFSALMVPPNLVFTIVCLVLDRRRRRRHGAAAPAAASPS